MQVKNCHVLYHFYVHLLCLECIKHIFMLEFSSNGANVKDEKRAYAYVTGPAKTGHICTNYTCSENGTFLGPHV